MADLDFHCRVCGKETDIAPDPPERAVCAEHCEDHEYQYDQVDRGWFCIHCNHRRPDDWHEDDA